MCVPFSDQYWAVYIVFGLKSSLFVNLTLSSTRELMDGFLAGVHPVGDSWHLESSMLPINL